MATIWEIRGFVSERTFPMSFSQGSLFRFYFNIHPFRKRMLA